MTVPTRIDPSIVAADGAVASTLVLLPGLDGTEVFFRPLLALLPEWISPLPLCYPDRGPYGYAELLLGIRETLAHVPGCHVLASSFSGPLAVMLAAAEPHKVRGIILAATFLRAPRRHPAPLRLLSTAPIVASVRFARRLPVWLLRQRADALREAKRETWLRVSAGSLAARARTALDADAREELRRCRQPVLGIAFAGDRVVPRRYLEEIPRYSAAARLVTLPGGHMGMFTDPAGLADEVVRFMAAGRNVSLPGKACTS